MIDEEKVKQVTELRLECENFLNTMCSKYGNVIVRDSAKLTEKFQAKSQKVGANSEFIVKRDDTYKLSIEFEVLRPI